jgi:serine protease Do
MYKKAITAIMTITLASFLFYSTPVFADHDYVTTTISKVMPAVVEVSAESFSKNTQMVPRPSPQNPGPDGNFKFRDRPQDQLPPGKGVEPPRGGSGFVISADGYVITNFHVVDNVSDGKGMAFVTFKDGSRYETDLINYDKASDIALLKIKLGASEAKKTFKFVSWGDMPEVGDRVIAIGSPMSLSFTTTFGNVSALDRIVPSAAPFVPFVQTDTSINPGNSGGPLFNLHGDVIGINTMIITGSGGSSSGSIGLGFAIDGTYAKNVIERLKTGEKIKRPFVGIMFRRVNKEDMKDYTSGEGAFVTEVVTGSPAVGILKAGDIILKVDGVKVLINKLAAMVAKKKINDKVVFTLIRNKQIIDIEMVLGEK